MKIAIIGSGISGLVCGYLLHKEHEITLFESNDYIGGHTYTHPFQLKDQLYKIDTGFIVYNTITYPNFSNLLEILKVPTKLTDMGFSVQCKRNELEYNGSSINQLFSQRKNLLNIHFYRLLFEIYRFNRISNNYLLDYKNPETLELFLDKNKFSSDFQEQYLYPMAAALWSCSLENIKKMPIHFLICFFKNHGLLNPNQHLQWRVIDGGSVEYVKKIVSLFKDRIRLNTKISYIKRHSEYVQLRTGNGDEVKFDQVIFANHSDQVMSILEDPSFEECDTLENILYQNSEVVLHYDDALLPKNKRSWGSWNYCVTENSNLKPTVTYYMNKLQDIVAPENFCVSLNQTNLIDPNKIIKVFNYSHPIYTEKSILSQKKFNNINGRNRTYFCGAYWGYGFHEDGVNSAIRVCELFGKKLA